MGQELLQETHKGTEWPSEHQCIWAGNTNHAINRWIERGFSKSHLSRNKEICGYKELHAYFSRCMQSDCKPTSLFHKWQPKWAFSLPGSVAAWWGPAWSWDTSQGCSWRHSGLLLITDRGTNPIEVLSKLQQDCRPGESPLEQGLMFLSWDPSSLRAVTLNHNRSSGSDWQQAEFTREIHRANSIRHKPCPSLRMRWAQDVPKLHQEFKKH